MARTRTTKKLAQRIDLNYFKRATPFKRAKFWLIVIVPLLAMAWIASRVSSKDSLIYSSGRMSEAHAVLEKECATCHIRQADFFSARVTDTGCLACHDGPAHHTARLTIRCAECHTEHQGRVSLSQVSERSCVECHGDLQAVDGSSHYANNIKTFSDGHPEFAVLRAGQHDLSTLKLNHALHMKAIRRGPRGPMVQLECGDCHRTAAASMEWNYSDPAFAGNLAVPATKEDLRVTATGALGARSHFSGRELMAPVKFEKACSGCHALSFDKRFEQGVPHDKPEIVHAFLISTFRTYIATHPGELREVQDPNRILSEGLVTPRRQTLTAQQWVMERTAVAEELLWRKTCAQCHIVTGAGTAQVGIGRWTPEPADSATGREKPSAQPQEMREADLPRLPQIAGSQVTERWLPHSKFDHDGHRGFSCVSCHEKALLSTESSEILIPGIQSCQTCHAPGPGYAESRCYECHTYHDWSKRREIAPRYNPNTQTGGSR